MAAPDSCVVRRPAEIVEFFTAARRGVTASTEVTRVEWTYDWAGRDDVDPPRRTPRDERLPGIRPYRRRADDR